MITAASVAAAIVGALGAKLLHDTYPWAAIALTPVLGVGMYALVRLSSNRNNHPSVRVALMFSGVLLTTFYFFVITGETLRPVRSNDPIVRLGRMLGYTSRTLIAAAVPLVIASVAFWQALGAARRKVRPAAFAPLVVVGGIGALASMVSLLVFAVTLAFTPRDSVPWVLLADLFVLPFAFFSVWTSVYNAVLTRWEVEKPPALVSALANLRTRCAFQFDRVICLDGGYGSGRTAAVTSTLRSTTLLMSEPLVGLLDPDELLAVLAHEAAHVEFRHARRKLMIGIPVAAAAIAGSVGLSIVLGQVIPRSLEVFKVMVIGALGALARGVFDRLVTRRHEREADTYAAKAVGAGALLQALEKLGANRAPVTANRWTTHSTWEIRSERLKDLAARGE